MPNEKLLGKITVLTKIISPHRNSLFGMRNYSEASGIHVPNAYKVIGKVYPNNLKNWNFGDAKAPGLNDHKKVHISNIDPLMIVQSRELSRSPKSNSSSCLGIESKENVELTNETIALLIPEIEINEIGAKQPNQHLVLWMSSPGKCFKIEMENRA